MRPQDLTELGFRTGVMWMALPLLRPVCRAISGLAGESTEEHDFANHLDRSWSRAAGAPTVASQAPETGHLPAGEKVSDVELTQ